MVKTASTMSSAMVTMSAGADAHGEPLDGGDPSLELDGRQYALRAAGRRSRRWRTPTRAAVRRIT